MNLSLFLTAFRDKVKEKYQVKRFSAEALAQFIGVDPERYRKWEKGSMPIKDTDRDKVKAFFVVDNLESIPENKLETGLAKLKKDESGNLQLIEKEPQNISEPSQIYKTNEARLRGDHSSDQYYMNSAGKVFTQIGEDSYLIHTPLVQKKARAGFMMGWGDETYINQLPTHPIVVDKPYKGYYVSFDVVGDSMDDGSKQAISDGDIVTGRRIDRSLWTSQLHIHDYPDFVIHTREGLLVKRIIAHNVKENYITIHSLNPDKETYPDQDISLEDVAELFNIIKVTSDRKAR